MPRTDATQVGAVIEVDEDISLTPFIAAANELVTEVCLESEYSDTRLAMIETWLAAHFYAMRDPRMTSVGAGVSVSYQSRVDLGLALSHYGQNAMLFDTKGNLAALDKRIKNGGGTPRIIWLGTPLGCETADVSCDE